MSDWTYNEFKHCGDDYSDAKQDEEYDERRQKFRAIAVTKTIIPEIRP